MSEYRVDPQALKLAADGINHSIEELKSIGIVETAEVGRGFDNLKMTGMEIGHPELQGVFDEFCERWAWGVRALVQDGNQLAERLNLSAGIYHDQEQYVSNMAKDVYSAAMGNPNLTQEQVEARSWGDTLKDNAVTQFANADYSVQSFQAAALHSDAAWKNTGADLLESKVALGQPNFAYDPEHAARLKEEAERENAQYQQMTRGAQ
ncbi:hypothetical protein [Kitasatospora sp. NPDC088134]|uniref:hypothetical protein n=1 Tax=Kitasatospora sp. NPDC088134 TaxID=3364071 RepID=UPI00382171DC